MTGQLGPRRREQPALKLPAAFSTGGSPPRRHPRWPSHPPVAAVRVRLSNRGIVDRIRRSDRALPARRARAAASGLAPVEIIKDACNDVTAAVDSTKPDWAAARARRTVNRDIPAVTSSAVQAYLTHHHVTDPPTSACISPCSTARSSSVVSYSRPICCTIADYPSRGRTFSIFSRAFCSNHAS